MDSGEEQKRRAMAEHPKRAPPALLPVSFAFLFLLVSFSARLPELLRRADLHLCLLLVDLTDCFWADRKIMFLVCNLILAVVARDAGLLRCLVAGRDRDDELAVKREGLLISQAGTGGACSPPRSGSTPQAMLPLGKDTESPLEPAIEAAAAEPPPPSSSLPPPPEEAPPPPEGEEGEEEEWGADMDELNKRFDEFIAKVRRNMVVV